MPEISDQELKKLTLLAAAVNQTLDGVAITDPQTRLLYVNQAFAEMHGYQPEELLYQHIYTFHNDQQKPQVDAAIAEVKATGKFKGLIWRVHKNGAIFPSKMSITVVRNDQGEILGILAIVRDVTEQLRTEEQLHLLSDNAEDVIWMLDLAAQRFSYVSPSVQKLRGYTPEEVMAMPLAAALTPGSLEFITKNLPQRLAAFYAGDTGMRVMKSELDQPRRDGSIVRTEAITTLLPDAEGKVTRIMGISRDITERQRAEAELVRTKNRLEAILSADPDIIMEVDVNKVYTWANRTGYEFFGDDVIGKEASYYFEGEQATYQTVAPLFKGSEDVIYVESWQRRKDGEKRLLGWWCRMLKDRNGQVIGVLSTARDITARMKMEDELREKIEELKLVNEVAIGRELKMIELEKEVDGLRTELGRAAKYQ